MVDSAVSGVVLGDQNGLGVHRLGGCDHQRAVRWLGSVFGQGLLDHLGADTRERAGQIGVAVGGEGNEEAPLPDRQGQVG